jgi:hypothetical protein
LVVATVAYPWRSFPHLMVSLCCLLLLLILIIILELLILLIELKLVIPCCRIYHLLVLNGFYMSMWLSVWLRVLLACWVLTRRLMSESSLLWTWSHLQLRFIVDRGLMHLMRVPLRTVKNRLPNRL